MPISRDEHRRRYHRIHGCLSPTKIRLDDASLAGFDGEEEEEEEDHTKRKGTLLSFTREMTFTREVFKLHWFHVLIGIDLLDLNCIGSTP